MDDFDYPLAYAKDRREFSFYRKYLIKGGYLESKSEIPNPVIVSANGWDKVRNIRESGKESKSCFVAMSFDPKFNYLHETIKEGVDLAGLNYVASRLDEPQDEDIIDNALIAKMKSSRFMVADLSGNNHGVYFEAGYMKALGRSVIFTCRRLEEKDKTLVDKPGEKLHFDVEHHPIIFWDGDNMDELKKNISEWIIAWNI